MSSSPQVRHDIFCSGGGPRATNRLERMPESFRLAVEVVFDLARLTCVFASAIVALRFNEGRIGSTTIVDCRLGGFGRSS